jgi:hypothetical protein
MRADVEGGAATSPSFARTSGDDAAIAPSLGRQIDHGSSDVAQKAIALRQKDPTISSGRNVAVFEYKEPDGTLQTIALASEPGFKHAEVLIIDELRRRGIPPAWVTRIYSELQPCNTRPNLCERLIKDNFPQAEVTWSFEYGASRSSRDRGMAALKKAIRDIDQHQLRFD